MCLTHTNAKAQKQNKTRNNTYFKKSFGISLIKEAQQKIRRNMRGE